VPIRTVELIVTHDFDQVTIDAGSGALAFGIFRWNLCRKGTSGAYLSSQYVSHIARSNPASKSAALHTAHGQVLEQFLVR